MTGRGGTLCLLGTLFWEEGTNDCGKLLNSEDAAV